MSKTSSDSTGAEVEVDVVAEEGDKDQGQSKVQHTHGSNATGAAGSYGGLSALASGVLNKGVFS